VNRPVSAGTREAQLFQYPQAGFTLTQRRHGRIEAKVDRLACPDRVKHRIELLEQPRASPISNIIEEGLQRLVIAARE